MRTCEKSQWLTHPHAAWRLRGRGTSFRYGKYSGTADKNGEKDCAINQGNSDYQLKQIKCNQAIQRLDPEMK